MPDARRTLYTGQLMFRNLTRDDAQVIQCNASNIHGYLWKDVALSILGKCMMVISVNANLTCDEVESVFKCFLLLNTVEFQWLEH